MSIAYSELCWAETGAAGQPYGTYECCNSGERACAVIEEREKLESLQSFEKSASDPSRPFAKGVNNNYYTILVGIIIQIQMHCKERWFI